MKSILIFTVLFIICSCSDSIKCTAVRNDISRFILCKKNGDSFYLNVWLNPSPIDSGYPQPVIDSINKLKSLGYSISAMGNFGIPNVDCSECQKILKLSKDNYCKEN